MRSAKRALRVLVVDDAPIICKLLCKMLAKLSHTCVTASDGKQAVELVVERGEHFDAIVRTTQTQARAINGGESELTCMCDVDVMWRWRVGRSWTCKCR